MTRSTNRTAASEPSDELLARWNAGDEAALEELLALSREWTVALARRLLGSALGKRVAPEDLAQEALLELARTGRRFDVGTATQLRRLLAAMLVNRLRDQNKRHRRERRDLDLEESLRRTIVDLAHAGRSRSRPDRKLEDGDRRAHVLLAIDLLPAGERDVVSLRVLEELPYPEIGARLGLSSDAVRMRFRRALPQLRERLRSFEA